MEGAEDPFRIWKQPGVALVTKSQSNPPVEGWVMTTVRVGGLRQHYFTGDTVDGYMHIVLPPHEEGLMAQSDLLLIFRVREQTQLRSENKLYQSRQISMNTSPLLDMQ